MTLMGHCSLDLVRSPKIVEAVLFVLVVDDLQLGLNTALSEDGTHEEGDKATEGIHEVRRGDIEVEVCVLGGCIGVGASSAASCVRRCERIIKLCLPSVHTCCCGWGSTVYPSLPRKAP